MTQQSIIENFKSTFHEKYKQNILVEKTFPVTGGCINNGVGIECNTGRYFLKWNKKAAYPGMFEAEMKGLKLLHEASKLTVPEPLFVGEADDWSYLVMTYVSGSSMQKKFWEHFGMNLAALHKNTNAVFGLSHNNYIGSLKQSNTPHKTWPDFFINERLEVQVQKAFDSGLLNKQHTNCFKRFYNKLADIFPEEPPALLHGDLWSGNYMVDNQGLACLIDPAVYYGHREMDIGMTLLFGGFAGIFYDAYNSAVPMEKGWQKRMDYCNLYPLLVHLNLFGSGYLGSVQSIISRF